MHYQLLHGDNREQLKHLADNSIDSIVCDPPYELGFMGKRWDSTGIAYDLTVWAECLRVLKPGGHLIAFGGTRTYHRMTVAIEDAGFEIRDCIMWLYGSGFPKSLAIDKAIDKQRDDRAQTELVVEWLEKTRKESGVSRRKVEEHFGTVNVGQSWFTSTPGMRPRVPTLEQIPPLLALFGMTLDDVPEDIRELIWTLNGRKGQPGEAWYQREVVDTETRWNEPSGIVNVGQGERKLIERQITAPATDLAKQWHGWGTALKPAVEPAVLARKPLIGTVADNVTTWGVGGLNIDGCRVGSESTLRPNSTATGVFIGKHHDGQLNGSASGRWPANVILDSIAGAALDEQSGDRTNHAGGKTVKSSVSLFGGGKANHFTPHSDSGGASRFFYTAKASKSEREAGLDAPDGQRANIHATVKPIALMRYLVRLVTPKDGTVLDPFMGSGSTGCAAMCEGMNFVGIELSEEYLEIARRRIEYWQSQNPMGL